MSGQTPYPTQEPEASGYAAETAALPLSTLTYPTPKQHSAFCMRFSKCWGNACLCDGAADLDFLSPSI